MNHYTELEGRLGIGMCVGSSIDVRINKEQ